VRWSPASTDAVASAVQALSRYRLRTALSVSGIAFGVAALFAMLCIGAGARAEVLAQVEQLGLRNVVVRYRSPPFEEVERRRSVGLTVGDVRRVAALAPAVRLVSPLLERTGALSGPAGRQTAVVLGVGSSYFDLMGLSDVVGRVFSPVEEAAADRICVLGADVAASLVGSAAGTGEFITVDGTPCLSVGVLKARRPEGREVGPIASRTFDAVVFVPWTTAMRPAADPLGRVDEIWLQVDGGVDPGAVGRAVARVLDVGRPAGRDFEVVVPVELLNQQIRARRTLDLFLGVVAAVTLLVGGTGVMNVMLTSVVERTSEIGLRRTAGATRRAIGRQFLIEAVIISTLGGVAGLALGIVGTVVVGAVGAWPIVLSPAAAAVALVVSMATGVLSGAYPARRAAAMNPIDAVRHE
jgi:putative ABC transport system permease protein